MPRLRLALTGRQKRFLAAGEHEVLFGGAAGGGKSYGQVADALLFALRYPKSRQLLLRRTFPELERSLIRTALSLIPPTLASYRASAHTFTFKNGSLLDFGYLGCEEDVFRYQSVEYDVIRFDELTHFTEFQYLYLISRVRGANSFPKQIKSSTNPGGIGHSWVKARFIDPAPPETPFQGEGGMSRIFLPARVEDNAPLMAKDPDYRRRLEALPDREKRALLLGDWNLFEGQFFREFSYEAHTVEPFEIPASFRRYRTLDYGLDRLAVLWIALSPEGEVYVYRELCRSDLIISEAAAAIAEASGGESYAATLAPPDLFSRGQESGRCKSDLFAEHGIRFTKTSNNREAGWLSLKELLKSEGDRPPRLKIFRSCRELIDCLPRLLIDRKKPGDCLTHPHEYTHAPDALRGFTVFHSRPAPPEGRRPRTLWSRDLREDYERADEEGRRYLEEKYGVPL